MKTKSILILSLFFSLFIFEKTFSKAFYIGQIISGEIEINKSFKIKRHQELEKTLKARGYHRLKFEDLK